MRLVLFDIDGTVLHSDGSGRRAMEGALTEIFGDVGPADVHYDGKTDRQIVRELMRQSGHSDLHIDERLPRLLDAYLERLERELATGERRPRLCAGVAPLLEALDARADVTLGLLTGNLERGAALKLAAVGIDIARFRANAFGSDHEHRPRLPAVAQRRAEAMGIIVPGERVVIVGDTPADIDCGREIGARAIAVATGRYRAEELAAHQPAALFADLSDTSAVLRALLHA